MNPILAALAAAASSLLSGILNATVPALLSWFQQHVLPHAAKYQGMQKDQLRAEARTWVMGLLTEVGQALVKANLVPAWLQPLLPTLEGLLDQAIQSALDKAGL